MRVHLRLIQVLIIGMLWVPSTGAQELERSRKVIETEGHPSRGPLDAPVTIVEFGDFECPYCGALFTTLQAVQRSFPNEVRLVFRQFPLVGIHQYARKAAEASLCAHEQHRFWEFHDSLFSNQDEIDVAALKRRALELSLDTVRFNDCLDSGARWADAERDIEAGVSSAVYRTPTMFINGLIFEGSHPYQDIVEVVRSELARLEP